MRRSLVLIVALSSFGCSRMACQPQRRNESGKASVRGSASALAASERPSAKPAPRAFARRRPDLGLWALHNGVDSCAYQGDRGWRCLNALLEEKDPIKRKYMRRIKRGRARLALEEKNPGGPAHAEMGSACKKSGPCGSQAEGTDKGYQCLTAAESHLSSAMLIEDILKRKGEAHGDAEKERALSVVMHARACRCDPEEAQIPVMGGTLACAGRDTPIVYGKDLALALAKDIVACSTCDAAAGSRACEREIARIAPEEAELAGYLKSVHVPRCQQP